MYNIINFSNIFFEILLFSRSFFYAVHLKRRIVQILRAAARRAYFSVIASVTIPSFWLYLVSSCVSGIGACPKLASMV
jgi:hypothetical protein